MNIVFASHLGVQDEIFETLKTPFSGAGHRLVSDASNADVLFFHARYGWGEFDWQLLNAAIAKGLTTVVFDFLDYYGTPSLKSSWFDWGTSHNFNRLMEIPVYASQPWTKALRMIEARGMIRFYFKRQMQQSQTYPSWVYPLEQVQYRNHQFPICAAADLALRPFDLCFIGGASQVRQTMMGHLLRTNLFKIDWLFPLTRLEHAAWLDRHRQAKLFIEMDGGGWGSDRPHQLMSIAPMLKQRHDRKWVHKWEHRNNCFEIGDFHGLGVPSLLELEQLRCDLDDIALLHSVYVRGASFMSEHFSEESRAKYILSIMRDHGFY
jgi:hypothetical protein